MTPADRYVKIVEWSDEDGAFVGQCPGVIGACCHGTDEVEVYRQLCAIVSEWLELADRDGNAPATSDRREGGSPGKLLNNSRKETGNPNNGTSYGAREDEVWAGTLASL